MLPLSWILGFALPIVFSSLLAVFYFRAGKSGNAKSMIYLGVAAILGGLLIMLLVTYTLLGGFGPGGPICGSTILTGIIAAFIIGFRSLGDTGFQASFLKLRSTVGIIIILAQLIPPPGSYLLVHVCDLLNRQIPSRLLTALDEFKQQKNHYPAVIEAMVPEYLDTTPPLICLKPYDLVIPFLDGVGMSNGSVAEYSILQCEDATYLTVPGMWLGYLQRYDLESKIWTTVDFLDNECFHIQE